MTKSKSGSANMAGPNLSEELRKKTAQLENIQNDLAAIRSAIARLRDPEEILGIVLATVFKREDGSVPLADIRAFSGNAAADRALKKLHYSNRGRYEAGIFRPFDGGLMK